jgi:hypothetical protein
MTGIRRSIAVLGAGVLLAPGALGSEAGYHLELSGFFDGYGSGMLTLDAVADATPSTRYAPSHGELVFRFTDVMGGGDNGNWVAADLFYDPVGGGAAFALDAEAMQSASQVPDIPGGLTPCAAAEAVWTALSGDMAFSRKDHAVPDGGATGVLGVLAFAGLGLVRRLVG